MNSPSSPLDTGEKVAQWIESAGYTGEISALAAGLYDLLEGADRMYKDLAPKLLTLDEKDPTCYDEAGEILMKLMFEFEHLERHCKDARKCLFEIVKHIQAVGGEFTT